MNERPARWLANPTAEDERGLIRDFGWYGLGPGLLDRKTRDLIDLNFDRFAPLLVAAQRPPYLVDKNLQRWFRERAKEPQRAAMKRSLREWLVADVREGPHVGSMVSTEPEVIAREVSDARLGAADALGDWQDREALPLMDRLLDSLPIWTDHALPRAVIQSAKRRITGSGQPRFVAESVTLRIGVHEIEVAGEYDFEGVAPGSSFDLAYPIASGEGLGDPVIEAVDLRRLPMYEHLQVSYEQQGDACRISLRPETAEHFRLIVRYRQPLSGRSATYLTRTALAWGEPLRRAGFEVVMPDSIGELKSTLPLREILQAGGLKRYVFEATPFQPDRDLVVSW